MRYSVTNMGYCIEHRVPWMAQAAIDEMKTWDLKDRLVLEWGSGGSTLFFSDKGARVISIEHNKGWWRKMCGIGVKMGKVVYSPPDTFMAPWARSRILPNKTFSGYAMSAINHIDAEGRLPDVIVVDGRARAACLRIASRVLKPGGTIVLDDANRTHYKTAMSKMEQALINSKRVTFIGGGPEDRGTQRHTYMWQESL